MSKVPCQTVGMRIKKPKKVVLAPPETVGQFGEVRLVRKSDGQHELVGGTMEKRAIVRAWCARFATFVVFAEPSGQEMALTA